MELAEVFIKITTEILAKIFSKTELAQTELIRTELV